MSLEVKRMAYMNCKTLGCKELRKTPEQVCAKCKGKAKAKAKASIKEVKAPKNKTPKPVDK